MASLLKIIRAVFHAMGLRLLMIEVFIRRKLEFKFKVSVILKSGFRIECHHPLSLFVMNIPSQGFCSISRMSEDENLN